MAWTPIIGRSFSAPQFAAYAKSIVLDAWKPSFVVVHNTGAPTKEQWKLCSGEQHMANLTHEYRDLKVPPWSAGPHLFVASDLIWVFTPLTHPGVHSPSWNKESWGVETVGDFETEEFDIWTRANLVAALSALHHLGNLNPQTIRFHKEDPLTTHKDCPGKNMDKAHLIARVKGRMERAVA